MSKKIAFIFPGQGSQYVGMGKDFYDNFSAARAVFQEADDRLCRNFSALIFLGPAEELTLTKNSQLAIYIVSYAIYRSLQQEMPDLQPVVCAGLSLGEYTALTVSNKVTFADGLQLVKNRALYMQEACESHPGSMSVVLGMEPVAVEECLQTLSSGHSVGIANVNCPGQVVISGTKAGLEAAAVLLKEKGAKRILPLDVSGAFHSPLMREAQEKLSSQIEQLPLKDTAIGLVMNTPGDYVTELETIRRQLILQVTQPVRWEKGIRSMMDTGVELFVEMGCGKTLAGMNKRIGVAAPTLSMEKVADLEELAKAKDEKYANA